MIRLYSLDRGENSRQTTSLKVGSAFLPGLPAGRSMRSLHAATTGDIAPFVPRPIAKIYGELR
jgi:hypothetical protein